MNFEFSLLGTFVSLSWLLILPIDTALTIILATLVFFSKSIPVNLLFLFSMNLIAFIQANLGGRKSGRAITEKRFLMSFVGLFMALFGASLGGVSGAWLAVFFGLLLLVPNGLTLIFFNQHYESLNLKSYIQSVLLPGFVALDVLLKIKSEVKVDFNQIWDVLLISLGLFTYVYSSLCALVRNRFRATLVYLSQAAFGLALFLLAIDSASLPLAAIASLAISTVSSLVLLNISMQLGSKSLSFAKSIILGLPGSVGFVSLFIALKMTIGLNILWILALAVGYLLQVALIVKIKGDPTTPETPKLKMKFWMVTLVQFISGAGLYWIEFGVVR